MANAPLKADGWNVENDDKGHRLKRKFTFTDFHHSMAFANAVAFVSHRLNHHPVMVVQYGSVEVSTTTHDAGNLVTPYDYELALEINKLL